jgi:hypothetical protein
MPRMRAPTGHQRTPMCQDRPENVFVNPCKGLRFPRPQARAGRPGCTRPCRPQPGLRRDGCDPRYADQRQLRRHVRRALWWREAPSPHCDTPRTKATKDRTAAAERAVVMSVPDTLYVESPTASAAHGVPRCHRRQTHLPRPAPSGDGLCGDAGWAGGKGAVLGG